VTIGWRSNLEASGTEIEKSQKVIDSHRNNVSPLTAGLNYRSACDTVVEMMGQKINSMKY